MTHVAPAAFAAFGGIDWAEAQHAICLQTAASTPCAGCQLEPTPAAIDAWGTTLRTRCNGQPVAMGLALTQGPLGSALRTDDLLVLCPIHPLLLARERDACTPSRAKDAPTAAARQRARLRTQRDTLPPLRPQSPTLRALAQRVEPRRRVGGDPVRITPRLTRTLTNSLPHVLHGVQEKDTVLCCAVLRRWPTLQAAPRARRAPLDTFCRAHPVRDAEGIAQRLQAIPSAPPSPPMMGASRP